MYYLRLAVKAERVDTLLAELWEAGTTGVVEGDGFVEAFFEDFAAAAVFGSPIQAADRDWVRETEDAWPPILVGEKFFVVAPWRNEPTPLSLALVTVREALRPSRAVRTHRIATAWISRQRRRSHVKCVQPGNDIVSLFKGYYPRH